MKAWASTGLDGLDEILCGLKKGDNVVWQVDSVDDYQRFVTPYVEKALADGRKLVYMRFANHAPLVPSDSRITAHHLDAASGFEAFSTQVHNIISDEGLEAYYVFDSLSDLLGAWATDLMIGNFFRITCPYLFELDTITYFGLLRSNHSFKTIARIRETTQLLLDVYNFEDNVYVHPLKVWNRYSPTMFLPHIQHEEDFSPLISSMDAARLFLHISQKGLNGSARALDYWDRLFLKAETLRTAPPGTEEVDETVSELCKIMVGREKRMAELTRNHFSLEDLMNIKSRLIGSGFIGGKAVGMLLARKILAQDTSFDWDQRLEPHDSFYVGSDVFYSYIVESGWWPLLMEHKTKDGYLKAAPRMKENLLRGKFPEQVCERFREMIDYFGQSPIIIRSSSLLEDSFGNAFAGKYESIFLVNQGDPDQRYAQLENAVRRVYASTMDENALTYRLQRGLDRQDEQMALLVQRVSGSHQKDYFFPDLAGVGMSRNTFVWKSDLDPKAGMIRLVFGLGTRAVDRVEDDYPQLIALDEPLSRPYSKIDDVGRFSQHGVDLLDVRENSLRTVDLFALLKEDLSIELDLIATADRQAERHREERGLKAERMYVLTFEKLLSQTDFAPTMQRMMKTLESHYQYPVDIEFTANFGKDSKLNINLLQCRPLQTKGLESRVRIPRNTSPEKIFFKSDGYTMGGSIAQPLKRIIYVELQPYLDASLSQKYDIARLVGKLNRQIANREAIPTILLGPGRWGTTTPSLGVPVSFAEINRMTVLVEIAYEGVDLMPELSFGTHFFQDLVETDIFYVAIFPRREDVILNKDWLTQRPNLLAEFQPESRKYADVVRVCEPHDSEKWEIMCDMISQRVICFGA